MQTHIDTFIHMAKRNRDVGNDRTWTGTVKPVQSQAATNMVYQGHDRIDLYIHISYIYI